MATKKKVSKPAKKSKIFSKDLEASNLASVINSEIRNKTLIGHHIDSFNRFTSIGINQIVTQIFKVEQTIQNLRDKTAEDLEIADIHFLVRFDDVHITRPITQLYTSGKQNILMPNLARRHNLNYSAPIFVDATITATAYPRDGGEPRVRTDKVKNFKIASIPIMVNSELCHIHDLTPEARKQIEEDPRDLGGYFILKGQEWVISMIESRLFNNPHIFRNVGHEKEIARLEHISKPGDAYENSSELIIRYVTNGNIYLTFTSNMYLKLLHIPFYIVFRLLGMTIDKDIIDNIVYRTTDKSRDSSDRDVVAERMMQVIKKAMRASDPIWNDAMYITEQGKLLDFVAKQTTILHSAGTGPKPEIDENSLRYLKSNIPKFLDKYVFPHVGLASDSRHKKLRYLGHLIHKLLLVEQEIVPSTDRDSLKNKRIHPAGLAYAKVFKTQFNLAIVQTIKKKLTRDFKNMPFSQVPLAQSFKSSIRGLDLERSLLQAIVTGNKELTVKNRQIANRLSSEILHRKNQLNVMATMRVIRTPSTSASKQDKRADEMRRVHPSYTGYICPIQSADTGEQVGMVKQMAMGASVSSASSSELLKTILLGDPEIVPVDKIFPHHISELNLTKITVNGDWIGCCHKSPYIVRKYREMRRGYDIDTLGKFKKLNEPGIDPLTTIYWDTDTNEINFWVDAGRMLRPILVVRNNSSLDPVGRSLFNSEWKGTKSGFVQDIIFTKAQADELNKGSLDITKMHEMGIIDYISPEELENCYIAESLDRLKDTQTNPLHQWTHCEIPESLLGLPALTCPFANHNQIPRVTFQTNQVKQTCGWYSLNWPYRIDKHAFLQYYCEWPLVQTMANQYIYPNGMNTIVAVACYGGYNQEDSLIYCQAAAERGLYKGMAFDFIRAVLEKEETFGNPDEATTRDIKKHANYEHLVKGFAKRGTMIHKEDAVIGKFIEMPKKQGDHRTYKDTSIIYPYNEPAMVETVIQAHDQEDNEFAKVKLSSARQLGEGDKFSSRAGQKGVTGAGNLQSDMLFTENGIVPGLILNPHAIPSRMTIGQLIEGLAGKLCALEGTIMDATVFRKMDIHAIGDALEKLGYDRHGTERMYDGRTGEWIDTEIFITPTYYQRLQKFVVDEVYSISTGPTCVISRQPLDGKANKGGLRIGEMEKDVIIAVGSGHFIMEKFRDDSDGFDIYVCRTCGKRPVVNEKLGIIKCNTCRIAGLDPDVVKIRSTWASKLFFQELESMNVGVALGVAPYEFEEYI